MSPMWASCVAAQVPVPLDAMKQEVALTSQGAGEEHEPMMAAPEDHERMLYVECFLDGVPILTS